VGHNLASLLGGMFGLDALRAAFYVVGVVINLKFTCRYFTFWFFSRHVSEVDVNAMLFFDAGNFLGVITAVDIQFFAAGIVFDLREPLFDKLDITNVVGGYFVIGYELGDYPLNMFL